MQREIWIQTEFAWYLLQKPAEDYRRHYLPFYIPRSLAAYVIFEIMQDETLDYEKFKLLLQDSTDGIVGRAFNILDFDSNVSF